MTLIARTEIPFPLAIGRGLRCRCPQCGRGKMFVSFLKANDACPHCGEELSHHRADDLPAYLVILVAGHLLIPLVAIVEIEYAPPYWFDAIFWLPLSIALCVGLLQPLKGMVIAIQWFYRMYDFAGSRLQKPHATGASATESGESASGD